MVRANAGTKLARRGDRNRCFLILNESKTQPCSLTGEHPGLPKIVPVYACLSAILINGPPFSFKNSFTWMINDMVIFNIYQKGISH